MIDPFVTLAGLGVGFVVGLTGMGGGALMTPLLVLLFGIPPLTAVSSDIVASMVMKPVGGIVHWKRGTVHKQLVGWLVLGSVPSAFLGVLLFKEFAAGQDLQGRVKLALGLALLVVTAGLVFRPLLTRSKDRKSTAEALVVRRVPTLLVGMLGGLVVGLTSVGAGSLMIILLLLLYPRLRLSELVGTDLVQAVPLVTSAALGHLLFGDFALAVTGSILLGSIPGVFVGARFSSRAPDYVIRPALIVVLLASGLKLLGAGNLWVASLVAGASVAGTAYALTERRRERQTGVGPAPSPVVVSPTKA